MHRKKQMPFFRCFKREIYGDGDLTDDEISNMVSLTQQVYDTVERELKLTGFWDSIPARNRLKEEIKKILLSKEFVGLPNIVKNRAHIVSRVLEIADEKNDTILYAA